MTTLLGRATYSAWNLKLSLMGLKRGQEVEESGSQRNGGGDVINIIKYIVLVGGGGARL